MPSKTSSSTSHHKQAEKQYYIISDSKTNNEKAIDLQHSQEFWKEPYTIDDADLMFDGKPLNMLYEENRWQAEHHVSDYHRDQAVRSPFPFFCRSMES